VGVNYNKNIEFFPLSCGERKGAEGGGLFFGASIACEKKI